MTDEPKKIKFVIAKKRIKWGWIRQTQSGDYTALSKAMASCLVGDDGEYLQFDQALERLDDLDAEQMDSVMETFKNAFRDWTVPPLSAAS